MKVIRCKDCALDGRTECPLSYIEKQTLCFVEHSPMFFCGKAKPTEDYQPTNGDVIRNMTDRQLAEWLTELKEAKRLLKAAVEDMTGMQFGEECKVCSKKLLPNECPIHNNASCIFGKDFKWRYADEALALIGEEGDTNG